MGGAASTENARATVTNMLANKPVDASDIKDLEQARAEIRNLRRIARDFQNQLRDEMKAVDPKAATTKKREAVLDRGEQIKTSSSYIPKVVEKSAVIKELIMSVVTTNILFSSYSTSEHAAIVDAFSPVKFSEDIYVIRQGESGDHFYVVQSGTLDIFVRGANGESNKVGSTLGPGSCFGELALMYNTPRAASIKCASDCELWEIDRNTYRGILVYYKYLRNKQYMEFLKNVEIMEKKLGLIMSESDLEKMTISLEKEQYEPGDAIIRQGNTGDQFYIIAEGDVGVYRSDDSGKETKLTVLHQGGYFGEKALLKEDVRQASCIAESKVLVLTLGRDDFIDMMGSVEEMISNEKQAPPMSPLAPEEKNDSLDGWADVTLSDMIVQATLGCGAFGRVKLCKLAKKDQFFALKCQAKRSIVESGLQEHVLNELRVMRKINHPFIAKLYTSLQDKYYIYFVLELLQGGELFTHLRNRGKLSENNARFYAAIVVYAFSTLHAKKIAYRDLKPENLVMDSKGYVKLVDFGLAKQLLSGKTWTLCGTPDYLAPEIILNEGHDLAVDYWALGVLIFEMVVGAPPFYAEDPMEVYEKILGGNPSMPSFFTRNLSDLIKKLLRSQQGKRLGNTRGGTAAVVKHKWFSSFDWAGIESGEAKAPFVPTISAKDDVTNFDQFDEGDTPPISDWNPDLRADH
eukprot:gene4633-6512_t